MPFVLDCSVTMSSVFSDESTNSTTALLESLLDDVAIVPQNWSLELANMLLVAGRRGRIDAGDRPHLVAAINALPIEVDREISDHALVGTLGLAAEQDLSAYAAAYLELALRRKLPMATLDRRLAQACRAAGVELVFSVK